MNYRDRIRKFAANPFRDTTKPIDGQFPNPCIRLHTSQEPVSEALLLRLTGQDYAKKKRLATFSILCANLIHAARALIVPMNKQYWSKLDNGIAYTIVEDIDLLRDEGLIYVKKGNAFSGKATHIATTKEFDMIFKTNPGIVFKPTKWVILQEKVPNGYGWKRNLLTGEIERYKRYKKIEHPFTETKETEKTADILRTSYYLNEKHDVSLYLPDEDLPMPLCTGLRCIHTRDMKHGGRLYTGTYYGVQALPSEWRQHIRIDNEPVVELDYASLHINMLYARNGKPPREDHYSVVLDSFPQFLPDEKPVIRTFLKVLLQSILNAKPKAKAVASGNYDMNVLNRSERTPVRNILKKHGIKVKDLIESFEQVHGDIAQFFYSEVGLELQYGDSRMALRVLHHFNRKGVVVLPVHDSFLIQAKYKDDLKAVMEKAYCSEMKTDKPCPIK